MTDLFPIELLNDADGETERGEQLLMMLIAVSDFLKVSEPVVYDGRLHIFQMYSCMSQ